MAVEPNDVRVLIPRVRRAIDGPMASGATAPTATLDDEQLKAYVADAIANVIFYSGGAFAHTLDVSQRDAIYGAPTEWTVNPPLDEAETTLVAAQAALDYFFWSLKSLKTQETIRDEGSEWSYTLSATLMRDQMNLLRAMRDKALETLEARTAVLETYGSFIAIRDADVSGLIEAWVTAEA